MDYLATYVVVGVVVAITFCTRYGGVCLHVINNCYHDLMPRIVYYAPVVISAESGGV